MLMTMMIMTSIPPMASMMGLLAMTLLSTWVSWSPVPPTVAKYLQGLQDRRKIGKFCKQKIKFSLTAKRG